MSDPKESIRKIANDLTNLEISTIIKTDMVGTKMPHPRHALIDISNLYRICLIKLLKKPPHDLDLSSDKDFTVKRGTQRTYNFGTCLYKEGENDKGRNVYPGGFDYLDIVRNLANDGIDTLEKGLLTEPEADLVMLYRIRDMSDQIKGVFNALKSRAASDESKIGKQASAILRVIESMKAAVKNVMSVRGKPPKRQGVEQIKTRPSVEWDNNYTRTEIEENRSPFPLTTDELVTIRKAWEIGTEKIVMQTVIQLDGDVVTRVTPEYATADRKTVHEIHNQSVTFSLNAWSQLVELVKDFFEKIIEFFASKKLL
jgi:hypothetical protein